VIWSERKKSKGKPLVRHCWVPYLIRVEEERGGKKIRKWGGGGGKKGTREFLRTSGTGTERIDLMEKQEKAIERNCQIGLAKKRGANRAFWSGLRWKRLLRLALTRKDSTR